MTDKVFDAYSSYYDLLYKDKDYMGEASYIQSLLNRHGIVDGQLLEFGSGTGKHGRLLATQGYKVHGIERSARMVAESETTAGFTCQEGDIALTRIGHKYDAVLSLFHVISYQTSNAQLQSVFANAAAHLNQQGLFIFDFWYSPAVYAQRPVVRVKKMSNSQIEITRIAEPLIHPNENRVDVNYTIYARDLVTDLVQTMTETHPMRHFTLPEIDILAGVHGFERIAAEELISGKVPSENTWGVCVILKRI